jgi:hypothetical protein
MAATGSGLAVILLVGWLALPECPLLAMTGVPCPTCGATRTMTHLLQGNPDFLHYNVVWAVVAFLVSALAACAAVQSHKDRSRLVSRGHAALEFAAARPAVVVAATLALALAGWLMALVNVEWIRG